MDLWRRVCLHECGMPDVRVVLLGAAAEVNAGRLRRLWQVWDWREWWQGEFFEIAAVRRSFAKRCMVRC